MRTIVLGLLLIIPCLGGEKLRLAVVDLQPISIPQNEAQTLTEELRVQLVHLENVDVMERGAMREILEEQGFQQSELCNSEECYVEMGQMIGVENLVVGSIGNVGKVLVLNIRLVNVNTGKTMVALSEKHKGSIEGVIMKVVPKIVKKLDERINGPEEGVGVRSGVNYPQWISAGVTAVTVIITGYYAVKWSSEVSAYDDGGVGYDFDASYKRIKKAEALRNTFSGISLVSGGATIYFTFR